MAVALSRSERASFEFIDEPLHLSARVERDQFESWIAEDLRILATLIDDLLVKAGVDARAVDRVFATGGSSLVPAVQRLLGTRFGSNRCVFADELTSVAAGLAIAAKQRARQM